MQNLDLTNLVLGAWLLFVVIRRQLEPRVIRFKLEFFILIILLGGASVGDAFTKQHLQIAPQQAVLFGTLSLVSAVAFAALRAWTYRFWVNDAGRVMRQGNWLTLVWGVVGIGGHLGVDPQVADLRITGSFPLNNIELALNALLPTLPVQIKQHTPWWVTVSGKPQVH